MWNISNKLRKSGQTLPTPTIIATNNNSDRFAPTMQKSL